MMKIRDGHGIANGLDGGRVDVVVDVDNRSASNTTSLLDTKDNTKNEILKY